MRGSRVKQLRTASRPHPGRAHGGNPDGITATEKRFGFSTNRFRGSDHFVKPTSDRFFDNLIALLTGRRR